MRRPCKHVVLDRHVFGGVLLRLLYARARPGILVGGAEQNKQRRGGVVVEIPLMVLVALISPHTQYPTPFQNNKRPRRFLFAAFVRNYYSLNYFFGSNPGS